MLHVDICMQHCGEANVHTQEVITKYNMITLPFLLCTAEPGVENRVKKLL